MTVSTKKIVWLLMDEGVCNWQITLQIAEDIYDLLCPRCGEGGIYTYRIEFHNCTCCGDWFNDLGDPLDVPYDIKEELLKHWYGY